MSSYKEVLLEKESIDQYMEQGFVISAIKEDLSGAWLELSHHDPSKESVILHILSADARIHLGNLLISRGLGA